MAAHRLFTIEDLASLLESVAEGRFTSAPNLESDVISRFDDHVSAVWDGVPVQGRVTGTPLGRHAISLTAHLGPMASLGAVVSQLLAQVTSTATTRVVLEGEEVSLEAVIVTDDATDAEVGARAAEAITELCTMVLAWRVMSRTGGDPTLDALVRATPLPACKALLVASIAFAVAGADGDLDPREAARLRAWLKEIPSFAELDLGRVIDAIATMVDDPARTVLEAARRLEPPERLLAWALANDMAHVDGLADAAERRYLSTVASVFELPPRTLAPLVAEAQARAMRA